MKVQNKKLENLSELYIQTLLLAKVIERILKRKANITLDQKPRIEKKPIIEFMRRMRVGGGVEKFNMAAYISVVNFFVSEDDMRLNKTVGAILLFIEEDYIVELFKKMGYPDLDEDIHEELEDACGTLCNLIAAKFKAGMTQLGYTELTMSHFICYRNEIISGINYDVTQKEKYEISFSINGKRPIFAELTMGSIPGSKNL